ncbi:DUF4148 domain-containing protein [Piscinibacter sp.]|uniref:DUF4148 domain-containing protein n=1 Tax=Piscinibacter sp. TaxID=1903157 RepID=UPI002D7E618C|nr:DUF4148 domain-containing protein [Albitalea sp.]
MKLKHATIASLIVVSAMSAYAQESSSPPMENFAHVQIDDDSLRSTLTRAEVLADLHIWQKAGLPTSWGEASYNTFGLEYRRARAHYEAMRASPQFAVLVQQIARQRGEAVAYAGQHVPSSQAQ